MLPTDVAVEDVRYVLDYYRLSADGRLLFGGGTVYGGTDPADIRAKLVPNLERVFPQLKGVAVDFAWSGNCAISFSRVPQLGRLGAGDLFRAGLQRARGGRAATSSGASSPRRCTATGRGSTPSRRCPGCPSRAGAASPCPIPSSAHGGMACAIASACETDSSNGKA